MNFKSHPLELAIYQEVSLYTMKSVIPVTQGKELSQLHILVSQVYYSKREGHRQSFMAPLVPLGTGTSISKISPHHPLFASVAVIFTSLYQRWESATQWMNTFLQWGLIYSEDISGRSLHHSFPSGDQFPHSNTVWAPQATQTEIRQTSHKSHPGFVFLYV